MSEEDNGFYRAIAPFFLSLGLLTLIRNRRRKNSDMHNDEFRNPHVQGLNRLKAHSLLCGFNSEEEARHLVAQPRCSPYLMDMNGAWQFKLFNTLDEGLKFIAKVDEVQDTDAGSASSDSARDWSSSNSSKADMKQKENKKLAELTTVRVRKRGSHASGGRSIQPDQGWNVLPFHLLLHL